MGMIVTAVYEKGVLRPLRPLALSENETVTIEGYHKSDSVRLIQELVAMGIVSASPGTSEQTPLAEDDRLALAQRIAVAAGRPVAEMIIEERRER